MDSVVHSALEEICSAGASGLNLLDLWPKLHSSPAARGLPLCPNVKAALWSNLLAVPCLRFHVRGASRDAGDSSIQSVEECEENDLRIIASERLRDNFVGIYDVDASSSSITSVQRRTLERLAIARHDGVTQRELAKEFNIKGNNIFYILKKLETRGLIVRQSTVVKTKEACREGEPKSSSNVVTNMLYLYRYAKHLGCQQRLEIVREDKFCADECDNEDVTGSNDVEFSKEQVKENVQVKDFLPALKTICDKLEEADGKVLVVSDIKRDLGYNRTPFGHRAWRSVYHRLKDACVVEDCCVKVNNKEVKCLRLLKKFSPKHFEPKSCRQGYDEADAEPTKSGKRGQVTDQLVELPIEQQIYYMIDAEGHKGLTITEICRRLGLRNKQYYDRLLDMQSRFGMHLQAESKDRGIAYRVWTSGKFNPEVSNIVPGYPEKVSDEITERVPCPLICGADNNTPCIQDIDASPSNDVVKSADGTTIEPETFYGSTTVSEDKIMLLPQGNTQPSYSEASVQGSYAELEEASIGLEDAAQPGISSSLSLPLKRRRRSYRAYPCLNLVAASALREQRILKMLEEEKFLIKPELHRRLENVENLEKEKNSMMDRKTLIRSLNKLQQEGRCKCINFSIPVVTNCGRRRSVEVVLHPSISQMSPEVLGQIHERLRHFEVETRRHSSSRLKGMSVPVLDSVERIPARVPFDSQAKQAEARRVNGFVLAKMVRTKLLHRFLWGYLSSSPGWDDLLSIERNGSHVTNPHSTSKLFGLDAAIKAMPLELFLQVVGSTQKFEDLIAKCRNGLRLSDLQVLEYKCLMDTRAIGCLSWLIDILRRLKLIRLVRVGHADDDAKVQDTTLTHALELKPYIEEPVSLVTSSFSGFIFPDLRPHMRHDFVLITTKAVDEYWSTLEYCYSAADSKAALHAFPGSAVHEIFLPRSWASARVMTADQRAELLKRVAHDEPHKRLSFEECRKIAKDLNLTLEQVLRIYQDKRQQRIFKLPGDSYTNADFIEPVKRRHSSLGKRKRSLEGKPLEDVKSGSKRAHLTKQRLAHVSLTTDQLTDRQHSFLKTLGDHENYLLQDLSDDQLQTAEEQEPNEDDENDRFFIHKCALSKLKPERKRRFSWTEEADRQLVIEYVRHRASLGAKFHRTDWSSLANLPAPPENCRRRMALLNSSSQFRKAIMRLCNMLADRYSKNLEKLQNNFSNLIGAGVLVRESTIEGDCYQNVDDHIKHYGESEDGWDNFEDNDVKLALDGVLRLKKVGRLKSSKEIDSDGWFRGQDHQDAESVPSAHLTQEDEIIGRGSDLATRRSRSRRLAQKYKKLLNDGTSISRRVYESVAVSNAAELFKLIFLSTSITPQASRLLADTLRHYSQHDLFAAFSYLRENKIMIGGDGTTTFALSQNFLHSISLSPFPTNTGKRALKFANWLAEGEKDLMEREIDLPADLQCGDIFYLCALMSKAELSITPQMPEEGIGEAEDTRTSKCEYDNREFSGGEKSKRLRGSVPSEGEIISRREKGFPGIRLSLSRAVVPPIHTLDMLKDEDNNGISLFLEKGQSNSSVLKIGGTSLLPDVCASAKVSSDNRDTNQTGADAPKSSWEAMSSYAEHLISSFSHGERSSLFHPELFRTACLAIQKSGDQGLSMKEFSKILNLSGQMEADIVVDVLEPFGRAFKVFAYDSVHVVDTLYRSKYSFTSVVEIVQTSEANPPLDSKGLCDDEHRIFNVAEYENDDSGSQDDMRIDNDDIHRITILNRPKEVTELSIDNQSTRGVEGCAKFELMSAQANPKVKNFELHSCNSNLSRPILPWINGDGSTNEIVFKGLIRRILGIVMQNPGILEDEIIKYMGALNPQSCRKLLEELILDNRIIVRRMHQRSVEPPGILAGVLGCCSKKSKLISREHYFANPMCCTLL